MHGKLIFRKSISANDNKKIKLTFNVYLRLFQCKVVDIISEKDYLYNGHVVILRKLFFS